MRILISTGDVSGDVAGGLLAREIRKQCASANVVGIGGERLADAGAVLKVRTSHLGVTGVSEVVAKLPAFRRASARIMGTVRDEPPSVAVLIGNDLFSGIFGRWLRRRGIPTISYFPPPTWMWGRMIRFFANSFDVVLASFPDEERVYGRLGSRMRVQFVGHYLADVIAPRTEESTRAARARFGFGATESVVSLMPGSREDEITRLLPAMLEAAAIIASRKPDARFVLPAADRAYRTRIESEVLRAGIHERVLVVDGPDYAAIAAADVVILASGTASLEATLLGVPMIVVYKVSAFTAATARFAIRTRVIDKEVIGLPNLILGRPAVPELTQHHVNGPEIAAQALDLLNSCERRRQMTTDLAGVARQLAGGGALARAAMIVLDYAGHATRA